MADEAISSTKDAGDALQVIVQSSENVMDMVHKIAAATEEQSSAADEVSHTMEKTAGLLNQNFVMSENLKNVADELVSVASLLKAQIENFKTADTSDSATDLWSTTDVTINPDNAEDAEGAVVS